MDKVKNALHLNKDHTTTGTTGTTHHTGNTVPEGTAGPHTSRVANAADPRVDSDLDSSRTAGTTTHGTTGTTGGYTGTGNGVTGTGSTNAGPHSSNLANKVDPRVDSDMDGSRNMGAATGTTGTTHTHGTTGGYTGTGNGVTGTGSTNAGPHNSNLANKIDPRVDSDMDGSRNMGAATGAAGTTGTYSGTHAGNNTGGFTGTTGGISHSTNAGPHDSNLANKVDPRVDSDLDGRGNRHGAATGGIMGASGSHATPGSGTAQNTAGPHNSDMLNKVDPRVDSDLSGGKTIGGNMTHA